MSSNNGSISPLYTTPIQFQIIEPQLYRGLYPTEENMSFLKTLNLKTVITVLPKGYDISCETPYYSEFIKKNKITLHQFQGDIKWKKKSNGNEKVKTKNTTVEKSKDKKSEENVKRRDKTVGISVEEIYKIIEVVADPLSYPIFLHDLTNETVTPLIVAIFRKLAYWNLVSIIEEFIKYSGSINVHERKFIEEFPIRKITLAKKPLSTVNKEDEKITAFTNWIRRVGI